MGRVQEIEESPSLTENQKMREKGEINMVVLSELSFSTTNHRFPFISSHFFIDT